MPRCILVTLQSHHTVFWSHYSHTTLYSGHTTVTPHRILDTLQSHHTIFWSHYSHTTLYSGHTTVTPQSRQSSDLQRSLWRHVTHQGRVYHSVSDPEVCSLSTRECRRMVYADV